MLSLDRPYDLRLVNGASDVGLLLARDAKGRKLWKQELAPGLAPVVLANGQLGYSSLPATQEVAVDLSDLSGGFGAYDHEPGRYQYAIGVDASYPGGAVTGGYTADVMDSLGAGFNGNIRCAVVHNDVLFIGAGQHVYRYDFATGLFVDMLAAGATVTDLGTYNDYLLCALGTAAAYQYSSDNGVTWVASTLADNRATFWAVVQDSDGAGSTLWKARLNYGIAPAGAGLLSSSNPSNGGAWSAPVYAGDGDEDFTSLRPGGSGRGLLIGKQRNLYRRAPGGQLTLVAGPYHTATVSGALANFAQGVELSGRVYYPVEDYGILEYELGSDEYRVGFAPRDYGPQVLIAQRAVAALATDGEWLYCALAGTEGYIFKGRYAVAGAASGQWVWHGAIAAMGGAIGWMAVHDYNSTKRWLWCGDNTAIVKAPRHLHLPRGNPLTDTSFLYGASGQVWYGRYAAGLREVAKVARRLVLHSTNLGSGRQIGVQWTADEGTEHALIAVTASPSGQIDFKYTADAVAAGLTEFSRLQLHLTLTNSGAGTGTPAVLRGAVLRSLLRPKRRWRYEFTVRLADAADDLVGGAEDVTQSRSSVTALLETAARQVTPIKMVDRNGVSRWVTIESYEDVELADAPPGQGGRFESGLKIAAVWAPDAADAPE